ncbi:MAG TPA: hypothetical protein VL981_04785 [Candidatus Methylacidiphilales bacterium]|nr:hypothetical protein [Candidatus Methylacidiphilales bacterium]
MNRNEFLIITGLSSLVAVLLIVQIIFAHLASNEQTQLMQAQQFINRGQVSVNNLRQVALLVAEYTARTGDQGLKDLMTRQNISIKPNQNAAPSGGAEAAPAPAPAPSSTPTH